MEIHTPHLLLRPYVISDLEAVYAFQSDTDALRFEPWGPNSREHCQRTLSLTTQLLRAQDWQLELAIARREDGHVVGGCRMELPAPNNTGWATIGYVIQRQYWGQGYASEAALGLIAHASGIPNVLGVRAISDNHNIASQRVLEKCGMECVGIIAETEQVKGRFRDMLKYELAFR